MPTPKDKPQRRRKTPKDTTPPASNENWEVMPKGSTLQDLWDKLRAEGVVEGDMPSPATPATPTAPTTPATPTLPPPTAPAAETDPESDDAADREEAAALRVTGPGGAGPGEPAEYSLSPETLNARMRNLDPETKLPKLFEDEEHWLNTFLGDGHMNAARTSRLCRPDIKNPYEHGSTMRRRPYIKAHIEARLREVGMGKEEWLAEVSAIARSPWDEFIEMVMRNGKAVDVRMALRDKLDALKMLQGALGINTGTTTHRLKDKSNEDLAKLIVAAAHGLEGDEEEGEDVDDGGIGAAIDQLLALEGKEQ